MGIVPQQSATLFDFDSDSYTTHYTENTITTESYEFALDDGSHVSTVATELFRSPNISGDKVKLGMLFGDIVSINGTFVSPMGLAMLALFIFTCYLTTIAVVLTWLKIPVEHMQAAAAGFTAGVLGASVSLALVLIPSMLLDFFEVPGWPLLVIAPFGLILAFLYKKRPSSQSSEA
jgi:hypothetical protein